LERLNTPETRSIASVRKRGKNATEKDRERERREKRKYRDEFLVERLSPQPIGGIIKRGF